MCTIYLLYLYSLFGRQLNDSDHDPDDFDDIIRELNRLGIAEAVYETVWLKIRAKLQQCTVPQFWKSFQPDAEPTDHRSSLRAGANKDRCFFQFQVAVFELHKAYGRYQGIVARLKLFKQTFQFQNETNLNRCEDSEFGERLRGTLLSQMPANFNGFVHAFYSTSFKVFVSRQLGKFEE